MSTRSYQSQPYVRLEHPPWCRHAVLYQINTRQFTPEGTFQAAAGHLPRLERLGVDVLYLMPIHPIGRVHRKGTLGSPYAVRDHFKVNPEFGELSDLQALVSQAHSRGMHVILDWVANHTAWDHVLVDEHPAWYARDWQGDFRSTPWVDWPDVIDLDFSQPGLREYLIRALRFWVEEADIDGYRCDVAGFVPLNFWVQARRELEKIKPVLLLAEWESRDVHAEAFDMSYAWTWYDAVLQACREDLSGLYKYYAWNEHAYPREALRMTFISNHDKNAWEGTPFEQFGAGLKLAIALSVLGDGTPLIYNGQEAGNPRRLAFFERDPITWRDHPLGDFYRELIQLKKTQPCLANGAWGGRMIPVSTSHPGQIFSFVRQDRESKVLVALNFSNRALRARLDDGPFPGGYRDVFRGEQIELSAAGTLSFDPWGFRVLTA